jgi:2-dehydropantoate 2-reductase
MERLVIWGAGAVGGLLGAWLTRTGHDPLLVDVVPEHVAAMRSDGLRVTGTRESFTQPVRAALPNEVEGPVRTVFLAVKCHHTRAALVQLAPLLAPDGVVVSFQNGLNENVIAEAVGGGRTLGASVNYSATWKGPGEVEHGGEHPIYVGELDGAMTPRLAAIQRMLSDFEATISTDNIWGYLWSKVVYGCLLEATALVDEDIPDLLREPGVGPILFALVREAMAVPDSLGIRLEPFGGFSPDAYRASDWRPAIEGVGRFYADQVQRRTGVWRDLAIRRRKTEIDCHAGALAQQGRRLGLDMSCVERLVSLIHGAEDGRPRTLSNIAALAGSPGA